MNCEKCGKILLEHLDYCPSCKFQEDLGETQSMQIQKNTPIIDNHRPIETNNSKLVTCQCGQKLEPNWRFCPKCNTPTTINPINDSKSTNSNNTSNNANTANDSNTINDSDTINNIHTTNNGSVTNDSNTTNNSNTTNDSNTTNNSTTPTGNNATSNMRREITGDMEPSSPNNNYEAPSSNNGNPKIYLIVFFSSFVLGILTPYLGQYIGNFRSLSSHCFIIALITIITGKIHCPNSKIIKVIFVIYVGIAILLLVCAIFAVVVCLGTVSSMMRSCG